MPERSACVEPNGRIRAPRPVARAGGRTIRADRPRGGQLLRAIRRHAVRNQRPRPPPPPRPRRSPRGVGGCARRWGSSFGAGGNHSIDPATAFSRNASSRTAPWFARPTVRASTWISASSWPASISKRPGRSAGFFASGQSTSPWPVSGTSSSRNVAWDARRTGCSWQRTPRRSGSSPRATSGSSRSARAARADESRGSVVDAVHSDSAGSDFRAEAPPADRAHEGSGGP